MQLQRKQRMSLQGNCLTTGVIYEAKVTTEDNGEARNYIGIKANDF